MSAECCASDLCCVWEPSVRGTRGSRVPRERGARLRDRTCHRLPCVVRGRGTGGRDGGPQKMSAPILHLFVCLLTRVESTALRQTNSRTHASHYIPQTNLHGTARILSNTPTHTHSRDQTPDKTAQGPNLYFAASPIVRLAHGREDCARTINNANNLATPSRCSCTCTAAAL